MSGDGQSTDRPNDDPLSDGARDEGRALLEKQLVKILTAARTGGPQSQSVGALTAPIIEPICDFIERRGRSAEAVEAVREGWHKMLVNIAQRLHSKADVQREARKAAHEAFPAFCDRLARAHLATMPADSDSERIGPMLEHFVYEHLNRWREWREHRHSKAPSRYRP